MTMKVLLFPWLGHSHISCFLELGKKLYNRNVNIHLCSTPVNLKPLRNHSSDPDSLTLFVDQLIELHLPSLPELPPHLHTSTDLPLHLLPTLKHALDMSSPQFSKILKTLKPDLLIYDMLQPWAPVEAWDPFCGLHHHQSENNRKDRDRIMGFINNSSNIILVKSFKEIEAKNINSLSVMTHKRIVPVGPLMSSSSYRPCAHKNVVEWLNTKAGRSTVFVSFGSDSPASGLDLEEIAFGLEKSNVNFVWISRCPNFVESFPLGFRKRTKYRGLLVEGWVPPATILRHKSIGGFVSNCAWSSVVEAMKLGVPIIAMPVQLDHPINARLAVKAGVGVEVVRDENGLLSRENVAAVVQHVVVSSSTLVRERAKKLSVDLRVRGEEDIDVVVEELLHLCKASRRRLSSCHGGGGGGHKWKRNAAFAIPTDSLEYSLYAEEEGGGEEADDSIDERAERFILYNKFNFMKV
uniref:UDP-glucosyltransferase 29-like n=1 Tax=Erigeron canadensis TaxID=72917 RepID=UPI001CB99031|nr:UDP-glucosyltransferase 29-like [Erigeron canadensis]